MCLSYSCYLKDIVKKRASQKVGKHQPIIKKIQIAIASLSGYIYLYSLHF